jgi:3-hydroxybutyryl-CoA dehydrogenase
MKINKVFIVGAGFMGSGIAQVCAQSGITVLLHDISQDVIEKGLNNIAWSVSKFIEKGKLTEDKDSIVNRISPALDFSDGCDADLVIEAVFENIELKQEIFRKLDETCQKNTILATNTSAISISELASVTNRPDKVVGLHFFSPVPLMAAVEVVRGMATSDETFAAGEAFLRQVGKEPI